MKHSGRQYSQLAVTAAVFTGLSLAVFAHAAQAQASKSVRLTSPFAAGGGTDILARLLADQISRTRGVTVVENRPGGGTVIATEAMSRAAPDGNNLLIVGNSS